MKGLILPNTAKLTFLHKSRQLAASLFSISYGYKRYYSELKVRSWHKAGELTMKQVSCERRLAVKPTLRPDVQQLNAGGSGSALSPYIGGRRQ